MMTNNTNKKILICVETNSKARTDLQYVDIALKDYYKIPNDIKISYLPMGSKSKYNDKGVVKKLKKK